MPVRRPPAPGRPPGGRRPSLPPATPPRPPGPDHRGWATDTHALTRPAESRSRERDSTAQFGPVSSKGTCRAAATGSAARGSEAAVGEQYEIRGTFGGGQSSSQPDRLGEIGLPSGQFQARYGVDHLLLLPGEGGNHPRQGAGLDHGDQLLARHLLGPAQRLLPGPLESTLHPHGARHVHHQHGVGPQPGLLGRRRDGQGRGTNAARTASCQQQQRSDLQTFSTDGRMRADRRRSPIGAGSRLPPSHGGCAACTGRSGEGPGRKAPGRPAPESSSRPSRRVPALPPARDGPAPDASSPGAQPAKTPANPRKTALRNPPPGRLTVLGGS